jgi:hypothetical protein
MKPACLAFIVLVSLLFAAQPKTHAQNANATAKLKVHVTYSGAGTVDEKHKVYVVLWDSPDFVSGTSSMPVELKAAGAKDDTVTFDDVKKAPAYVSTVYDNSGAWDAQWRHPRDGLSGSTARLQGSQHRSSSSLAIRFP